jgi:hypothetical protein
MSNFRLATCVLSLLAFLSSSSSSQVTTSQYDNARTGANLSETILTPANVNVKQFGKVFTFPVDGPIYAQPLYLPAVEVPGKGVYNVVYVATENDSVYAFDADGKTSEPLWKVSFAHPEEGITPVPARDVDCPFISPEVGITSTPVIDRQTGTLYVLVRTKERKGMLSADDYVQRLHALAITTGTEKFGGPVAIQASVPGNGAGSSGGRVKFNPLRDNPRASLLLVNDRVYLTWASSCDVGPYHGWVMAYDANTLAQAGVFNTSPDAQESGIWAGDTGPAADRDGNIFVATGNGTFDAAKGGRDYGDSVLKLGWNSGKLEVLDYFTPYNQDSLNRNDKDLGSGGVVLLPDQPGSQVHALVVTGKGAVIHVVNRDTLGKFHAAHDSNALQELAAAPDEAFGAAAYWNGHVYYQFSHDVVKDFAVSNGRLSHDPVARGTTTFVDPGSTPTVSANGKKNAIVWVLSSRGWRSADRAAVLYAYDAANVARELYSSEQNSGRDHAALATRFSIPTVINGRVYIGTRSELDVYGLLPKEK